MKPDHLLIAPERISVKCATCRQFIDGSAHCIGLDCYDEGHCPVCRPVAPPERVGPVVGMGGEQGGLW